MQRHFNLQGSQWDMQLTKDGKMVLSPFVACNRNYDEKYDIIVNSHELFFGKDKSLDYSKFEVKYAYRFMEDEDEESYTPLELEDGFETGKFQVIRNSHGKWFIKQDFAKIDERQHIDLDRQNQAFVTFTVPSNVCVFDGDEKFIVKKVYDDKRVHFAILLKTADRFHYCSSMYMSKDIPGVYKKIASGGARNIVFEPDGKLSTRCFSFSAEMQ